MRYMYRQQHTLFKAVNMEWTVKDYSKGTVEVVDAGLNLLVMDGDWQYRRVEVDISL